MTKEYKYKHGVSIMRAQPFHIGHDRIVKNMLNECENVTVVLYSVPECDKTRNPLKYSTRKKLIENVYERKEGKNRLSIIGFFDKYNPRSWCEVDTLEDIHAELPNADVYYVGNEEDANKFRSYVKDIRIVNRNSNDFPKVSASMIRDMLKTGDTSWKNYVHPENYMIIEKNFSKVKE